jgi:8-oxo-dGTP pyrophosphatase MutT (NUDIX family)|tara:strand:- start:7983 stop:8378 length:396 start_codon:yes stop_codon:yes gene_type:complete
MIRMKVKKDSNTVVKVVVIDSKNRILLLKRSVDHKKYPGARDLPGGHTKQGESIEKGLKREVYEETGLKVKHAVFFKKVENKYFYHMKYDFQKIKLSSEHISYGFYAKENLNKSNKFEKIALEVLEMIQGD